MSLQDLRKKDSLRVSAGSLWQDSLVMDQSANSSVKHIVSPRSRTRAISVAYIVNEDASVPQSEGNLSLTCLRGACADVHASLHTVSFESLSLGTTDVLDGFYNAGKCWHVDSNTACFTVQFLRKTEPSCTNSPCRRSSGRDERLFLPAFHLLSSRSKREFQHDQQHHFILLQTG